MEWPSRTFTASIVLYILNTTSFYRNLINIPSSIFTTPNYGFGLNADKLKNALLSLSSISRPGSGIRKKTLYV